MSSLPGSSLPGLSDEPTMYAPAPEDDPLLNELELDPELDLPPRGPATAYDRPRPRSANPLRMESTTRTPPMYMLYVRSNANNNIVTFTRPNGAPLMTVSGGQCGFKHKTRATAEAAHQCAVRAFARVREEIQNTGADKMGIEIKFNGWGRGREAVFKALMATEGEWVRPVVKRVTDVTPIKIGGTRAKKARRM